MAYVFSPWPTRYPSMTIARITVAAITPRLLITDHPSSIGSGCRPGSEGALQQTVVPTEFRPAYREDVVAAPARVAGPLGSPDPHRRKRRFYRGGRNRDSKFPAARPAYPSPPANSLQCTSDSAKNRIRTQSFGSR